MTTEIPANVQAEMDMLNALSEQDIRDLLFINRITGHRGQARRCPLATFLTIRTGERVDVFEDSVEWMPTDECEPAGVIPVSQSVCDFVSRFDEGEYPELHCPLPCDEIDTLRAQLEAAQRDTTV